MYLRISVSKAMADDVEGIAPRFGSSVESPLSMESAKRFSMPVSTSSALKSGL
jgi:hypothetical protein